MKFFLTAFLCLCSWSVPGGRQVAAQTPDGKPEIADPTQFDVITGNVLPADEKARLDNLIRFLRQDPERVAHIFVYASKRPCAGETRAKIAFIKNHFVKTRGIEPERVFLRDGGYRVESTVELWLQPRMSELGAPTATPNVDPEEVRLRRNCRSISRPRRGRPTRRKR